MTLGAIVGGMTIAVDTPPGVRDRLPRRRVLRLPLAVLGLLLAVAAYLGSQARAGGTAPHRIVPTTHFPAPRMGDHPIKHPATVPVRMF
jgi:hypothetical protein